MHIDWAVYGEVKRGHDLIGASGELALATKMTQFTDQPGEIPRGMIWGIITSGFPVDDHYVILRTLADGTTGRPGMVRSYAAFLPILDIDRINNLTEVLSLLPTGLPS